MDFFSNGFEDDSIDRIFEDFFKNSLINRRRFIVDEEEERTIDYIEDNDKVYLLFELPGYSKEDISVKINERELNIITKKESNEKIESYLKEKLNKGIIIRKKIPTNVNTQNFHYTIKNGILEIIFDKKNIENNQKESFKKEKVNENGRRRLEIN